jgi:hypothetical protein
MTRRMKLGRASRAPNHNPLMLSQRIAQLDQMAQAGSSGAWARGFLGDPALRGRRQTGESTGRPRAALDVILDL